MTRADLFRAYLTRLAADVAADGKFVGVGSDKIEAAARALLSGTGGMLEALIADVRQVTGEKSSLAAGAVAGLASRFAEDAIRTGINRAFEAAKVSLDKNKRARRDAGKAIMDAAKRMG